MFASASSGGPQKTHTAPTPTQGELDIRPINAQFTGCPSNGPFPPKPPECATTYGVSILAAPPGATKNLHYEWYIQLNLIDPAGSPPGAAFDPTCTNAELPKGKIVEGAAGASGVTYYWAGLKALTWYHGDPGVYSDNPAYGCNHQVEGPSGHQGIVTLIVDDSAPGAKYPAWMCQANYYGTNTGVGYDEDVECRPESQEPSQRYLLTIAYNDEAIAVNMLHSPKSAADAKGMLEKSLNNLKSALGDEKRQLLPDPAWLQGLQKAIKLDDDALNALPENPDKAKAKIHAALLIKDRMLEFIADPWGWAPPPPPLPRPGH